MNNAYFHLECGKVLAQKVHIHTLCALGIRLRDTDCFRCLLPTYVEAIYQKIHYVYVLGHRGLTSNNPFVLSFENITAAIICHFAIKKIFLR